MALRWIEGFDRNIDVEALARVYTGANTSMPTDLVAETAAELRPGVILEKSGTDDDAVLHTPVLVASPENTWIIGFAFRPDDTNSINTGSSFPYVSLRNTDGEQIRVEFVEDFPSSAKPLGLYYKLRIMRGVTEIASSDQKFEMSFPNSIPHWIYFQFKITLNNTTGSVEGRYQFINKSTRNPSAGGHAVLTWDASVSGIDTQEQSSTGADSFQMSFDTGGVDPVAFDDMYVCDGSGAKNNDFLGRCFVGQTDVTTTGGGAGATTDWALVTAASTEDAWSEPANNIENDKRLTSDTVAQIHLAAMDTLVSMDDATIIGVRMDVHGRMETSGSLAIGFMWRKTTVTAAQIEFGTPLTVSSTSMEAASVIAEDDPNTLTDWLFADLDTYQFGVKNNG